MSPPFPYHGPDVPRPDPAQAVVEPVVPGSTQSIAQGGVDRTKTFMNNVYPQPSSIVGQAMRLSDKTQPTVISNLYDSIGMVSPTTVNRNVQPILRKDVLQANSDRLNPNIKPTNMFKEYFKANRPFSNPYNAAP
jgi:hypothetical protein